jgi:transcriptional regulator with XRE-family HTH domain
MLDYPLLFGEVLREYRTRHCVTFDMLAKVSGWSKPTLKRLEANKTEPTLRQVCSLALILDIPIQAVLPRLPPEHPTLDDLVEEKFTVIRQRRPKK